MYDTDSASVGDASAAAGPQSSHRPVGRLLQIAGISSARPRPPRPLPETCGGRAAGAGGRLEAVHRVVHPGRDPDPDAGRIGPCRAAPTRPRQHRHPRAGAGERRGRSLPRVHRNDRSRAAQAGRQSGARRAEPATRDPRAQGGGSVRLQQHVCPGDDRGEGARAAHQPHLRPVPRRCAEARLRPVARIPAARRRLAGVEQGLWRRRHDADRPRPRPGLRRGRRRPRRRHRRLLDRCQARSARPDGARGRPRASSRSTTPSS